MRKGSRVTIEKDGSAFHGRFGTIRLVDRGPSAFDVHKVQLEPFDICIWYLVEIDGLMPTMDESEELLTLVSPGKCVWFREKEVIPLRG